MRLSMILFPICVQEEDFHIIILSFKWDPVTIFFFLLGRIGLCYLNTFK